MIRIDEPSDLKSEEAVDDAIVEIHKLIGLLEKRRGEVRYEPVGTAISTIIIPYMRSVPYGELYVTKEGEVDWSPDGQVFDKEISIDMKAVPDESIKVTSATSGGPPEYTGDYLFEVPAQFVHNTNTNQVILKYDASGLERLVALMREKVK